MRLFIYIIYYTLNVAIEIMTLLMFVRAILSWFPMIDRSSKIMSFIYTVTEFVIAPVRRFIDKRFPSARRFPLDISFIAAYLLLHMTQILLSWIVRIIL